jgi:predicted RNA-binding Zn-ribbon protein involved in translation (DUF1610 family)
MACDFCTDTHVLISEILENGCIVDVRIDMDDDIPSIDVCAGTDENKLEWTNSIPIKFCPNCGENLIKNHKGIIYE